MSARGVSVRPFMTLFVRPGALMMAFMVLLALILSAIHLGMPGLSLAFTGRADPMLDPEDLERIAHQLVLHGSALTSLATGMMCAIAAAEVDMAPRVALAPGFRASMRAGLLLFMVLLPALAWGWAHAWAPPASLWQAMALIPWWFALPSCGRLLARLPRWTQAIPLALLALLMLKPHWYVRGVDALGWGGMLVSLIVAPVAVIASWSPHRREFVWLCSRREFHHTAWMARWLTRVDDTSQIAATAGVVAPPATRLAWMRHLDVERADSPGGFAGRVVAITLVLALFVFIGHGSPGLLGAAVPPTLIAGRPLLYPLSRRDRARLQFLNQLRDAGLYGIAGLLAFALVQAIPPALLPAKDFLPLRLPSAVHVAAALALWPLAQVKSLPLLIHSGDPATLRRKSLSIVLGFALGFAVYVVAVDLFAMFIWREAEHQQAPAFGAIAAVAVAAQFLWFLGLHWRFARADLAPGEE